MRSQIARRVVERMWRNAHYGSALTDGPELGRGIVSGVRAPSRCFPRKSCSEQTGDNTDAQTRNPMVLPHAWDMGTLRGTR